MDKKVPRHSLIKKYTVVGNYQINKRQVIHRVFETVVFSCPVDVPDAPFPLRVMDKHLAKARFMITGQCLWRTVISHIMQYYFVMY